MKRRQHVGKSRARPRRKARRVRFPKVDIATLSDREIANLLHGRAADDNGEFTASSMGAAQDALRRRRRRRGRRVGKPENWTCIMFTAAEAVRR